MKYNIDTEASTFEDIADLTHFINKVTANRDLSLTDTREGARMSMESAVSFTAICEDGTIINDEGNIMTYENFPLKHGKFRVREG